MIDPESPVIQSAMPLVKELANDAKHSSKTKFCRMVADAFSISREDALRLVEEMIREGKLAVTVRPSKTRLLRDAQLIAPPIGYGKRDTASLLAKTMTYARAAMTGDRGHLPMVEPEQTARKDANGDDVAEVWLSVPGTGGRFEVSNFAHVRQLGRKSMHPIGREMVFGIIPRNMTVSLEDKRFGWLLMFDGGRKFYPRDELMALFKGIPVILDKSEEQEALVRYQMHLEYIAKSEAELEQMAGTQD